MTKLPAEEYPDGLATPWARACVGKVAGKAFIPLKEPAPRTVAAPACIASRGDKTVLDGVKRLFRAAMKAPLPRAGTPLRHARQQLDAAHERLLKVLATADVHGESRTAMALAEVVRAEWSVARAAGGATQFRAQATAVHAPPLMAYSFTDLLLLRQRVESMTARRCAAHADEPRRNHEAGSAAAALPASPARQHPHSERTLDTARPPVTVRSRPAFHASPSSLAQHRQHEDHDRRVRRARYARTDNSLRDHGLASDSYGGAVLLRIHETLECEIASRGAAFRAVRAALDYAGALAGWDQTERHENAANRALAGALRELAQAVRERERYGEYPARFLGGLAGRLHNDALANLAASLAACLRIQGYCGSATATPQHVAISASDGGAQTCARILKDVVDECLRERLVLRARLALEQGMALGNEPARTLLQTFDMLNAGVAAMEGDLLASHKRQCEDRSIMRLFAKALATCDAAQVRHYLPTLDDGSLQAVELNLPAMPAARRRRLIQLLADEQRLRRRQAPSRRAAGDQPIATRHQSETTERDKVLDQASCMHENMPGATACPSYAVERISMRAAPVLARFAARIRAELERSVRDAGMQQLRRMSFDVTPQSNGEFEVAVHTDSATVGKRSTSWVYKGRLAADLRTIRGAFGRE